MGYSIDFEPVGRRGECPAGAHLLQCARLLGVDLVNLCGGSGSCGRCIVQVLEGEVSPPTARERKVFTGKALAEGYRLACLTVPAGDCKIGVPAASLSVAQRTQVEGLEVPVVPEPLVRTYQVRLAPPSLDDLQADDERLRTALSEQHGVSLSSIGLAVLEDLSDRLRAQAWQATVAVREEELIAVEPPGSRSLGLAVDLGTTKVAGYLLDLNTGETLATRGLMNPQISYGEDVVARMAYAAQASEQAARLQALVVDSLNTLMADLCEEAGTSPSAVLEAVVVGNTAMHHLLLGLPVAQLARAPYVPAVASALDVTARDIGLEIAPGASLHLPPNVAGYVGGDHVAMLLATGMHEQEGVVLALDIGTNTEVCLVNCGRLTSLSCASGPAFEGAHIKHGMRAAPGAIEHLELTDGDLAYQTVGGAPPVGLCGSGILDTLAQLHRAAVVDRRGRMRDHARVRGEGRAREFVLVTDDERTAYNAGSDDGPALAITFTQQDVRELQLAKGAIRTGIQALLETNNLSYTAIERVIIAGAFGTYIDVGSAIDIGMLPPLPLDRFKQVGNAAGMGAKLALISETERAQARDLAGRVAYLELATMPTFSRTFARSMYLGRDLF